MINAIIEIVEGKILIKSMTTSGKEVSDACYQLQHLKTILDDTLFNFEKENQKQFIPTKETIYKLPIE